MRHPSIWFRTAVLAALMMAGCTQTGPDLVDVSGTVTMDDQPLEGAWVQFVPLESGGEYVRPSSGTTDKNGYYELEYSTSRSGVIPGSYRVSIMTGRGADVDATGQPIPGVQETVPMAYNYESDLTADVSHDERVFDFDLKSSAGPVIGQR